jgi:Zn-dependent peptidase ImmA (M78 family)
MNRVVDTVSAVALGFIARFGEDCGSRLAEIAKEIGLSVEEVDADKFDGALLRISGLPRGTVVLNKNVREHGRKLFTLAHEIGHYLLPDQQEQAGPCGRNDIGQWSTRMPVPELQANRFAAEILMPEAKIGDTVKHEPDYDLVEGIAEKCGTTLTAAMYRYVELSSFRIAMVWSTSGRSIWYKASEEFGRAIELGPLSPATYAYDCFQDQRVPQQLEAVPAEAWLYNSNLRANAKILEQSLYLPFYKSVLSLLYLKDRVEERDDFDEERESEMDPDEFTIYRRRWPNKR